MMQFDKILAILRWFRNQMLFYIHIPFCDSKCYYCAFNSYVDKFHLKDNFIEALKKQIIFEIQRYKIQKNSIETLYIGGGTPSTICPLKLKEIIDLIKPNFDKNIQISIEANPNSASLKWLKGVKSLGVNRISFGVQSFDDKKLKFLGRNHTSVIARLGIENAKKVGFENISIDLIYGTSLDTKQSLKKELEEIDKLDINHISLYSLTLEENTKFFEKSEVANDNLANAKFLISQIQKRGFEWYEISNFGKNSYSEHNLGYWRYKDYVGAGAGAVGFLKDRRFYSENSIEKYIKNPTFVTEEVLSKDDMKFEKLFLGFRSIVGVNKNILNQNELKKIKILLDEKKIMEKDNRYFNKDFLLADELALFIMNS